MQVPTVSLKIRPSILEWASTLAKWIKAVNPRFQGVVTPAFAIKFALARVAADLPPATAEDFPPLDDEWQMVTTVPRQVLQEIDAFAMKMQAQFGKSLGKQARQLVVKHAVERVYYSAVERGDTALLALPDGRSSVYEADADRLEGVAVSPLWGDTDRPVIPTAASV